MWVSDIIKYSEKYRVYALDLPGEPGRSDERQLSFTTTDLDDWLYDVLNELTTVFLFVGVKDIMLHSMETAYRMKELVPNARINILPDRGHSIINLTDEILGQIK